jgi:hypothetical protein
LRYTDEDGEFWHIIAGAVIGGFVNLAANWNNIEGFWDGCVAFVVGAGAGAATAATGGAGASVWTVAGVSAGGAAVTSGTNSVIDQTGKNFSGFTDVNWGQVGVNSAIGGVAGFAGGAAGYGASNSSFLVNGVSSPVLRSAVVSPLASGACHLAGGTTANLFAGQSLDVAFANSFKGIGKSMAIGTALGVSATIGVSYANGVNPLTGKTVYPANDGFLGTPETKMLQSGDVVDRYGGTYEGSKYLSPEGTPIDARSLPPNSNLNLYDKYQVVKPFSVQSGAIAPWFGQPGGGIQYYTNTPILQLMNQGYLIKY